MKGWLAGALVASTLAFASPAVASTAPQVVIGYESVSCPSTATTPCFVPYGASLPFSGSVSFSAGWVDGAGASGNPYTLTSSPTIITLPSPFANFIVQNTGSTNAMVCQPGATITNAGITVPALQTIEFLTGSSTQVTCQSASGTTLSVRSGSGFYNGVGGGGGGGGSGSNASVGTNGATAPTSSTQGGVQDSAGNLQPLGPSNPMPIVNSAVSLFGGATPASGAALGASGASGVLTSVTQAGGSVPINIVTATTTQLVALVANTRIYVTAWDVIAAGAGNITLEYGTGTACGTGTTALTGAYNLAAQAGLSKGNGLGPVLFIPASNALCAVTSAAVQMSGSLSYSQY